LLSDRRQRVLAALIEEYVSHALPVGSRTLVQNYRLGVSSATVRNELSHLEGEGYITQPHTSAGRIPTDMGYRVFVDDLLANEAKEAEFDADAKAAAQQMRESASELDELIDQTAEALTRLTNCMSIVVPPSVLDLHIAQVSLVSMTARRVLIVVVTQDGQVLNRSVEFSRDINTERLGRVQTLINQLIAGKNAREIKEQLDANQAEVLSDELLKIMLGEVFACIKEGQGSHTHALGLSSLLKQPEFETSQSLLPLLQVLEDDTVLLQILDGTTQETTVTIGHENKQNELSGVSVVASSYGVGPAQGVVAVIGPTRMDYEQVIKAVRAARTALDSE